MRRLVLVVGCAVLIGGVAQAGDELKPGWTPEALAKESTDCTEALVQGAWNNTKQDQGVDPAKPLTPEIRKQLAPQIAAMEKLCGCAIRHAAQRYSKAEAERTPKDLAQFVSETIANGTCKLEP